MNEVIKIQIKKRFSTGNESVSFMDCKQLDPLSLFAKLWLYGFQSFKENEKARTYCITVEYGKRHAIICWERFVALYACARPVTYKLSVSGVDYNCHTIKKGLRDFVEKFINACKNE